jgi:hypothetical protein
MVLLASFSRVRIGVGVISYGLAPLSQRERAGGEGASLFLPTYIIYNSFKVHVRLFFGSSRLLKKGLLEGKNTHFHI